MFSVSFIENRFYENLKTFFKKPKDFIFSLKKAQHSHSKGSVKTNRMGSTKWTSHKERDFDTNYFIYLKI